MLDLNYESDNPTKYINTLMVILFTREERRFGIIKAIEASGRKKQSERDALDSDRIALLKGLNLKKVQIFKIINYMLNFK